MTKLKPIAQIVNPQYREKKGKITGSIRINLRSQLQKIVGKLPKDRFFTAEFGKLGPTSETFKLSVNAQKLSIYIDSDVNEILVWNEV